ncbi:branched-chain amino acid ABC transporter permease [Nonomuraea sp. C10]|uniref:branched-chain amino acid ABC transporter permease n=1 Tax=Nonomuraea sp. C10 TaxID=2600577 RepID=UPI0011CE56CE|nr:branched-chain amino acid ABC transporter permease [Nonomuraea sp. C10]TXK34201.1 branched-chain amino acid ABC transporter permease [Nonomuraea sp. C10]
MNHLISRAGLGILVAVAVVAGAWARSGSGSVTAQAVLTGLLLGGVYALVAMGLTLIFGVLDIVNFAHGAFMTLGMYATALLATGAGLNPYLSLLVSVPLLFGLGYVVQRHLVSRTMGGSLAAQLLLTLGIAMLLENALLLAFSGDTRTVAVSFDTPLRVLGAVADLSRVLAFAGAMGLAGAVWLVLTRTRLGTAIRAVAANPEGASLVGLDVRRLHALTFAAGTACAGAAGTLVTPLVTVEPTAGELFNIIGFVVVVLGGLGSVPGAVAGGLIVGLTEQLGGIYLPGQSPLLAVFAVFVLVLLWRPQGLFGRPA